MNDEEHPELNSQSIAEQITDICRRLHTRNMLASADGNISFRLSNEHILITPSGKHKGYIKPSDLAVITLENEILSGSPSSERLMHLEVYRRCKQARCVVHAHPPTAIAWSVARPELTELPFECLSEVILAVGRIPIVAYARPSTQAMGDHLREYLPQHRVMILARHGALSWGETIDEAYNGMERLEHSAHILKLANDLGGLSTLPNAEVAFLKDLRTKLGDRTL